MGCCNSKDTLKNHLLEYNCLTDVEFIDNLKSKLGIIENPNGFITFVYFILTIRSQKLYPIDNNKLVSSNHRDLRFLTIKNTILESNQKVKIFKLINTTIMEINNDHLFSLSDKNYFLNICQYLYQHWNYSQML